MFGQSLSVAVAGAVPLLLVQLAGQAVAALVVSIKAGCQ
jgi:hypothetical protein